MNTPYLVAGILIVLVALVHSVAGEIFLIGRLQRLDILQDTPFGQALAKRTLRMAWHVTTVIALGTAVLVFRLATSESPDSGVARVLAAAYFGCFPLSLIVTRGKHPSWVAFLAVALLLWFGS